MAENEDGMEKTEDPTPKRREEARKDGKVVTSNEVFVFSTLAMGLGLLLGAREMLPGLSGQWAAGLAFDGQQLGDAMLLAATRDMAIWVLAAGMIVGIPMIAVIIGSQAAMGGLNFAPKAMGFKISKINPWAGIKRMVSGKALVNLGKAVLKVVLLLTIAAVMAWPLVPAISGSADLQPGDALALFATTLIRVVSGLLGGLLLIAGIDLGYQIYSTTNSLKMTRQEIKEEFKESEGSPEIKGQMRRRQMEASRRASERKALADVPLATAIVTNPTHFAVALRYIPGQDVAPVILAMGRGPMAHEIIKRGRKAGVSTLRVPVLARALYYTGEIGQQITDGLFAAVAAILAHVWHLEKGGYSPVPDVDLPKELQFDAYGRRISRTREENGK